MGQGSTERSKPARYTPGAKVWMDGRLVDWDKAQIHVVSHVVQYGSGVFEGIRVNLTMVAYRPHGHFEGIGGCRRDLDRVADKDLANLLAIPQSVDASTPYRPFTTTVAAAIAHLRDHVDGLRAAQKLIDELRTACEDRARLEMLLRNADPVDATVLRNHFDRADHHQPIPVGRLPLEHPLILDGFSEDALNQRTSRAIKKLEHAPRSIVRRPHPISLADLICEGESPDA